MNVAIEQFRVRWALADQADASLAEAVMGKLVDDVLDDALSNALDDVAGADLVALQSVSVPAIVVHGSADAITWGQQVAAATVTAVAAGGANVVRYRSVRAATVDIVIRAARGDLSRTWAWRQLGLWPPAGSAMGTSAAVEALLTADAAGVVPVLEATGAVMPEVLALLGPGGLRRVAEAAWSRLGARLPAAVPMDGWRVEPSGPGGAVADLPASLRLATRRPLGAWLAGRLDQVVSARRADDRSSPASADIWAREPNLAVAALLVAYAAPAVVSSGGGPDLIRTWVTVAPAAAAAIQLAPAGASVAAEHDPREPDASAAARAERAAVTRWAGLLFCLHLLRSLIDPTAPSRLERDDVRLGPGLSAAVDRTGWPSVLGPVGLALLSTAGATADPHDPALLAWCGLGPTAAAPPGLDDGAGLADELKELVASIVAALRARLKGRPISLLTDQELVRAVARRTGRVIADPGWIEVVLDLDEVSVDVRAAGLDLDLGWLPELGCVVGFRYE